MRSGTDPVRNISAMRELVGEAASRGAAYVQTPEMTGALVRDRAALRALLREPADDPVVKAASEIAAEHRLVLHIGSTAVLEGDMVANRAFVFGPDGDLRATYDKIHMFDVDLDNGESWRESATYRPGAEGIVVDLAGARLGLAVCYDIRFPHLFRDEALAGAEILSVPAAFTRQTGEAHWHVLLRARAVENGAWVIAAAQGGRHEDGRETYGHSLIVDPWGRIVAEATGDEPCVIDAEIDLGAVAEARRKIPNLLNARPFAIRQVGAATGIRAAS